MRQEVLQTQHDLDPTTPAIAVDLNEFPFAIKDGCTKYIVVSKHKEVCIKHWNTLPSTGYEIFHRDPESDMIPIPEMIAELEDIILKLKNSL